MTEQKIGGTVVRVVQGDITALEVEAFVFDARPDLVLGSGYGGAITQRGGPTIQEELKKLAPLKVGEAVASGAGTLKAKAIIHAVGPKFQEADTERKLREATLSALKAAEERGITQLALPPMGTGFYGVPLDLCARVMVDAVVEHARNGARLTDVVFCALDRREAAPFEARVATLAKGRP
jgi:O-acetyl-ADP-ribose deacetylase (regulator of RNase III)